MATRMKFETSQLLTKANSFRILYTVLENNYFLNSAKTGQH